MSAPSLCGGAASSGASGATRTVVKQVDETVNNSTTLQDDDELTLPVEANTSYSFEVWLHHDAGAAPDLKVDLGVPSGATYVLEGQVQAAGSAIRQVGSPAAVSGQGAPHAITFTGSVIVGSTAGNFTVQWAQNTADAANTTVLKHSHLTLTKAA